MNNKLITLGLLTILSACGPRGHNGLDGSNGINGTPGAPGSNGHNTVLSMVSFSGSASGCTNGGVTILSGLDSNDSGSLDSADTNLLSSTVCNGVDGLNGTNGTNGVDGQDGVDGVDGQDGIDGQDAPISNFTPVAVIDPCGDAPGIYDEVLLRLYNGQILASFSDNANGKNTRFSLIPPGNYITTDDSNCHFSVDALGNVN